MNDAKMKWAKIETPVGDGFVAWTDKGVTTIDTNVTEQRFLARIIDRFGEPPVKARFPWKLTDAPVDLTGLAPFQQKVLKATMTIKPGQVLSYGDLARKVGHPGAARAVGSVMARNPIPLLIPCHRVVKSDGTIGHYGLGGQPIKRMLLEREGALLQGKGR